MIIFNFKFFKNAMNIFEYYKMLIRWLQSAIYAFILMCIKLKLYMINEWNFKNKSEI